MRSDEHTRESSPDRSHTRRQVLRAGGAALTAGVAGSTAGCLSLLPPAGQRIRYGRVDVPAPSDQQPAYRTWIPSDSALSDLEGIDSVEDIGWRYVTPGNLGKEKLGVDFNITLHVIQASMSYFGTALSTHEYLLGLGDLGSVAVSNIDRNKTESVLRESGFQPAGSYQGYSLFDRTDVPRLVAVSGDAVVQTRRKNRHEKAETLIDAGAGRVERRHEVEDTFAQLTEWTGTYPTLSTGLASLFSGLEPEASVMGYSFDEKAGYFIYNQLFANGETPTKETIKQELGESINRATKAWSVDIEIDGRQVSIQMRSRPKNMESHPVPFMTWGVDHDTETITIRHEAGDPVSVENLEIRPQDALTSQPETDTIGPGDTLTFRREQLQTAGSENTSRAIRLVYSRTSDASSRLFTYDPDAHDTP